MDKQFDKWKISLTAKLGTFSNLYNGLAYFNWSTYSPLDRIFSLLSQFVQEAIPYKKFSLKFVDDATLRSYYKLGIQSKLK